MHEITVNGLLMSVCLYMAQYVVTLQITKAKFKCQIITIGKYCVNYVLNTVINLLRFYWQVEYTTCNSGPLIESAKTFGL